MSSVVNYKIYPEDNYYYKITRDEYRFYNHETNYHYQITASGFGFCGEITGGLSLPINSILFSFEAGYRVFYMETNGQEEPKTHRKVPFIIDQSGFVVLLSAGYRF